MLNCLQIKFLKNLLVSTYNKLLELQLGYHDENKIVRFVLFTDIL